MPTFENVVIPTGPPCWHILFDAPPHNYDEVYAFQLTHFVDLGGFKLAEHPVYYRIDHGGTVHLSREPLEGRRVGGPFTPAEVIRRLPQTCQVCVVNYHANVPAGQPPTDPLPRPSLNRIA